MKFMGILGKMVIILSIINIMPVIYTVYLNPEDLALRNQLQGIFAFPIYALLIAALWWIFLFMRKDRV